MSMIRGPHFIEVHLTCEVSVGDTCDGEAQSSSGCTPEASSKVNRRLLWTETDVCRHLRYGVVESRSYLLFLELSDTAAVGFKNAAQTRTPNPAKESARV